MEVKEYQKIRYEIITGLQKIIGNSNQIFKEEMFSKVSLKYILMQLKAILGYNLETRKKMKIKILYVEYNNYCSSTEILQVYSEDISIKKITKIMEKEFTKLTEIHLHKKYSLQEKKQLIDELFNSEECHAGEYTTYTLKTFTVEEETK